MGDKIHNPWSVHKMLHKMMLQQSELVITRDYLPKSQPFIAKFPLFSLDGVSLLSYRGGIETQRGDIVLKPLWNLRTKRGL